LALFPETICLRGGSAISAWENLAGGWKTKAGRGGCLVGFPSQVWRTKNLLRKREKTTF